MAGSPGGYAAMDGYAVGSMEGYSVGCPSHGPSLITTSPSPLDSIPYTSKPSQGPSGPGEYAGGGASI